MSLAGPLPRLLDADGALAPVGIFDSGVGGLSVLRHVRDQLPHEHLLYVADTGYAPYGEKPEAEVIARTLAVAAFLVARDIKALVIACNTATAAAIGLVRQRYPDLIVIGVEPGLKPAALASRNGIVGVMATAGTLASRRFAQLRAAVEEARGTRFLPIPCNGLADQIEKGELRSHATANLLQRYLAAPLAAGADTLVLGCTHYPFVQPLISTIAAQHANMPVQMLDTGHAVARQLARRLAERSLVRGGAAHDVSAQETTGVRDALGSGAIEAFTTGSRSALRTAFSRLLQLTPDVHALT